MIRRSFLAAVFGACAAAALAFVALRPSDDALASAPSSEQRDAAANDWSAAAPGVVEPAGGFLRLGFPDAGRIAEVRVRPGDAVKAGDVLMRLDDEEQKAHVAAAEAELAFRIADRDGASDGAGRNDPVRLKSEVAVAEQDLAKAQAAFDAAKAATPDANFEQDMAALQAALETADAALQDKQEALRAASAMAATRGPATRKTAAVDAARADLTAARAEAGKTILRAPVDGTVLEVVGKAGELILSSSGEPTVTMGGAGRPAVRAELDESDASKVEIGDDVTVRGDGIADGAVRGRVVAVAPMVSRRRIGTSPDGRTPLSNAQEVRAEIETPAVLLPGARVDVFFEHSDKQAREAVK